MKELLSNEEIDTLLEMFRSDSGGLEGGGDLAGDTLQPGRDTIVSPVDLLKPNRLSREQMQNLERTFEACAKALGATMTDNLRFDMKCDCVAVEQTRFQSWIRTIGNSVAIYMIKAESFDGPILCSLTTNMLYGAVDRILGGSGAMTEVPKEFSEAEYTVADAFTEPCIERIRSALGDLLPGEWKIEQRFTNPSLANVMPGQDVVLGVHFQTGGDHLLGDMRIAIPYAALERNIHMLVTENEASREEAGRMRELLDRTVRPVEVEMSVMLGETEIPLRQLMELKAGDVVPLPTRLGEPLVAPVQGVAKFKGQVGTVGNRLAYQVADVIGDA